MANPTSVRMSEDIKEKLLELKKVFDEQIDSSNADMGLSLKKSDISISTAILMSIVKAHEYYKDVKGYIPDEVRKKQIEDLKREKKKNEFLAKLDLKL